LQGATVKYNTSWGENGTLVEQSQRGNYSITSINTAAAPASSSHSITINASSNGYEYQEVVIPIALVYNTTIDASVDVTPIYYTETTNVSVQYTFEGINTSTILNAILKINGTLISTYWDVANEVYNWTYDSVAEGLVGTVLLMIEATKDGCLTRSFNTTVTILPNPTETLGQGNGTVQVTYGETRVFWISYNDTRHSENITDALVTITSNCYFTGGNATGNYTFIFNQSLNTMVDQDVTITLIKLGYDQQQISITFDIQSRTTDLSDEGGYLNGSSFLIYWNNSYSFTLNWTDTVNNTRIQVSSWLDSYDNTTFDGNYYDFTFNGTKILQLWTVTIRFKAYGYDNKTWQFNFDIQARPTGIGAASDFINGSTVDYLNYTDVFLFQVEWEDLNTSSPVTSTTLVYSGNGSSYVSNYSIAFNIHIFQINATDMGTYEINITFERNNYVSVKYHLIFVINEAHAAIVDSLYIENTPLTSVDIDRFENLTFWVVWNDTDHDSFLNDTSVDLLVNNSVTGELVFVQFSSSGNHSFRFNTSTSGIYNLTLVFDIVNYTTTRYTLWIAVGLTTSTVSSSEGGYGTDIEVTVSNIQFNSTYDFWVYWNSSTDGASLNDSSLVFSNTSWNTFLTNYTPSNGYHNFTFNAASITGFSVTITFQITDYKAATFKINFNVIKADTNLSDYLYDPSSQVSGVYYADILSFWVIWQDVRGNNITGITPVITPLSITPPNITFNEETSGNYTFIFNVNGVGALSIQITFTDPRFENQNYILTFIVERSPTGSDPSGTTIFNGGTVDFLFYLDTYEFNVTWIDSRHGTRVEAIGFVSSDNASNYLTATPLSNGVYHFLFNSTAVGTFLLTIDFSFDNYTDTSFVLTFIVNPIITDVPVETESLPTSAITGDTVLTTYSWDYNEAIIRVTFEDNELLVNVTESDGSPRTYQLSIDTHGVIKGSQELVIHFEKYGYENKSVNASLLVLGHTLGFTFTVPDNITQGVAFSIEALVFINDPIVGSSVSIPIDYRFVYSNQLYSGATSSFKFYQQDNYVEGEEVSFEVELELENGTIVILKGTRTTGADGIASYEVPATTTQDAVSIIKISAAYAGSDFYNPITLDYVIPGGSILFQINPYKQLINLLTFLAPFIVVGFAGVGISGFTLRRRRQERRRIQRIRASATLRIADISSINKIFCRHVDGVTFYNEDLYGVSGDTDAIAGMSTAITAFIDDVGGESTVTEGIERMDRDKFAMLSYHGSKATITIISTSKLSKFIEEMLEAVMKDIEETFTKELQSFYSSDQIPDSRIRQIVRKHLPLGLLDAMTIDRDKLKDATADVSKEQQAVLKGLIRIKSDLPAPFPVFFTGSIQRQMNESYDRHLVNQCIEIAFKKDFLVNLTDDQVSEVGRASKPEEKALPVKKSPVTAKRVSGPRKLPAAPKKTVKKLPAAPKKKK
jgi:hypothetical protein